MPCNTVAYIREAGGPGELEKHIADIQGSGLTTVILCALHMGWPDKDPRMKVGDFIYNDYPANLLVSGGKFNPNGTDAIARWPAQVAKLKQQSGVSSVFLSVEGLLPYWADFGVIQGMFTLGQADTLKQSLVALKQAFIIDGVCAIDGFDIDCEEDYISPDTIVRFCAMVFDLGFKVTFCPYDSAKIDWWQECMQTLWNAKDKEKKDKGYKVSWWNLQCYSGGYGNLGNLQQWIDALGGVVGPEAAPSHLVPGLAPAGENDVCNREWHCPDRFETRAAGWKTLKLGGMFLWRYDPIPENPQLCDKQNNLANYVKAITQGLTG